jgi:hypothetical protein
MPPAFAVKMWNWTKMGARVFVTPGEIPTPASFSHPFLPAVKVTPPPAVAELPPIESHAEMKADRGTPESGTAPAEVKLDLRSTVGQSDKPVAADAPAPRDQTRTAEAAVKSSATMSDAQAGPTREEAAAGAIASPKPQMIEVAKSEPKQVEPTLAEAKASDAKPQKPVVAAKADGDDARAEQLANAPAKTQDLAQEKALDKSAETKPEVAKAEPPRADGAPKASEAKAEPKFDGAKSEQAVETKIEPAKTEPIKSAKPANEADNKLKTLGDAPAKSADAKKDQTRLSEAAKPAAAKPEPPKRSGQIAVFVSRKDSKLYVRQNFEPLFQVPVIIAASDRPLGTHVFTAEVDKSDSNVLHWSVVSLPAIARAARDEDGERVSSRRRKGATPPSVEAKPLPVQNSPAEALDRITVPQDAMTRIAEALVTGGSIIVSDQGINQGETGEGTDFIVRLY